jgi:uncharacterized protein YciI
MHLVALLVLLAVKPGIADIVPKEFDQFWLVIFHQNSGGPALAGEKLEELQVEHLLFLRGLSEKRTMLVGGPVGDAAGQTMEGIAILRGDLKEEEVRALFAKEPMVEAGVMRVEVFRWMTPKGSMIWPEKEAW